MKVVWSRWVGCGPRGRRGVVLIRPARCWLSYWVSIGPGAGANLT